MSHSAEHQIGERAYALWEKEGSPHGRDQEFWERALLMVEAENAAPIATPLGQRSPQEAAVDTALAATFPASDPPSFTPAGGAKKR